MAAGGGRIGLPTGFGLASGAPASDAHHRWAGSGYVRCLMGMPLALTRGEAPDEARCRKMRGYLTMGPLVKGLVNIPLCLSMPRFNSMREH